MPKVMEKVRDLSAKLDMLLKACSMSRVALAKEVGVDKSLVGRWVKGTVHPGEHNLSLMTSVFQKHFPTFTLAHWYEDTAAMAKRVGLVLKPGPEPAIETIPDGPFAQIVAASMPEIGFRAETYEGFWRTTRPSVVMPGELFHDYGMFRLNESGMIDVVMEGAGLTFTGWMFPMSGNLYVFLFDPVGRTPLIVLLKGVTLPRAMSMEGLLLLSALDPGRTPAALPIILERLGDLSGDRAADDVRLREIIETQPQPLDPLGDDVLRQAAYRDTGPLAAKAGGDLFMAVSGRLSHGQTSNGLKG